MTGTVHLKRELEEALISLHEALNERRRIKVDLTATQEAAEVYLNAIPLSVEHYGKEGLQTQLLYILCNLNWWKGERSREARKILKKYAKQNPFEEAEDES